MSMIGNLVRVTESELNAYLENSDILLKKIYGENTIVADLDKAWCGIFYLLTDCALNEIDKAEPPLSWTMFSGQIIDQNQDLGYGPAHYVTASQVKEVNTALQQIPIEELMGKYDADEMNESGIYPEGWELEESKEYIRFHYELMRNFYKIAAERNEAVVTWIS